MPRRDLEHPVSRREFLGATGRCAAALGCTGVILPLVSCSGEEPLPPVQQFIVDTHMHVWADDPARYPFPHPYIPDFRYDDVPAEATTEMLLRDMDRNGVTHSILVQVIYHGWDNTYVVDSVKGPPGPLSGTWAHRSH